MVRRTGSCDPEQDPRVHPSFPSKTLVFPSWFSFFKLFRCSQKDASYGMLDINRYFHNVSILM